MLEPNEIIRLKDLQPETKADGGKIVMNDGCGRMSREMAIAVRDKLGLSELPSAFQGRIGGAKGLWLMDVQDTASSGPWIEIYDSQEKWVRDYSGRDGNDPAHRTFDVKKAISSCKPGRVNEQFIALLGHGETVPGTMKKILGSILERQLKLKIDKVKDALGSPQKLRRWVYAESGSRGRRMDTTSIGYLGGLPDEDEDQVNLLLDAGFLPSEVPMMRRIVRRIFENKIRTLEKKLHITVPKSTNTYIG